MKGRDALHLRLRLEGPSVADHLLPLSELQRVAERLRGTLRSIAIVLTDYGPSGRGGRVRGFIERSVDLNVIGGARAGSFVLEMATPDASTTDQEGLIPDVDPRLGDEALRAFIDGLDHLSDDTVELPRGYDRGVLKAIDGFRQTFRHGIDRIVFTTSVHGVSQTTTQLDPTRLRMARQLVRRPYRAHATVEGALRMVDDSTLEFRIEQPSTQRVSCYFDEKDRETAWAAGHGRKYVRVSGMGEFFPGESRPRRLHATSIAVVYETPTFDTELFWRRESVAELAAAQGVEAFRRRDADDDWYDDDEADALIAAIEDES
ncbi:hypothetical protein [Conexibacter arvalis]|uniref:Uncharacterized protein n=1 Tax=Conexibacter arvalis TaxID=912552 RepID=A0A840IBE5_9ACTN|nr:hypothetical protein [Conexibacter arvalis]MBB4661571.1 hypothetical protein [Conexibacter arvalis]